MLKRALDLILCVVALPLAIPVLAACAIAIRLTSHGPVLFRQKRLAKHGSTFEVLKFRSMYVNAPDLRNPDGSTWNGADDPRVTRAGKWLRRTSLDELPQIFNILRGEMSVVGPRPDVPDAVRHYRPQDRARLTVKPGVTGWAQVHGRNALSWALRRDYDLEYVAMASLWLDIRIMLRTVPLVLFGKGVFVGEVPHAEPEDPSEPHASRTAEMSERR
ncbi:MAG: sugar transferase [Acidobacteriaceae bacterium]|jgi:lipopolysaccharide/colanic/teichoic acid biosynthesis glycosyltransferase